jgi:hypothetical protein
MKIRWISGNSLRTDFLKSIHCRSYIGCRELLAKFDIGGEKNRLRAEVHGRRSAHADYARLTLYKLPDSPDLFFGHPSPINNLWWSTK